MPHLKLPLKCNQFEPKGWLENKLSDREFPNVGALRDTDLIPIRPITAFGVPPCLEHVNHVQQLCGIACFIGLFGSMEP